MATQAAPVAAWTGTIGPNGGALRENGFSGTQDARFGLVDREGRPMVNRGASETPEAYKARMVDWKDDRNPDREANAARAQAAKATYRTDLRALQDRKSTMDKGDYRDAKAGLRTAKQSATRFAGDRLGAVLNG
jgi:hypothetical protein